MLRNLAILVSAAALVVSAAAAAGGPKSDEEKTIYALGVAMSQSLGRYGLTEKEVEIVKQGLSDGLAGTATVDIRAESANIQKLAKDRAKVIAAAEKADSAKFLAEMAAKPGAVKEDSGLVYIETKAGTGPHPAKTDVVKVHYTGTLRDGTVFDSSRERGTPATFPLNRVIKCWTEGVQKMKVGGTSTLVCPSDIAYGDRGSPPKIKPGAALVFEVELLGIEEAKKKPELPAGHP